MADALLPTELTNVPRELLEEIMWHTPQELGVLCQVNSYFRDLAYSIQFEKIKVNPLCDIGTWQILVQIRPLIAQVIHDISVTGDSKGRPIPVFFEDLLQELPLVHNMYLLGYNIDYRILARCSIMSVRHLCIHNCLLSDIW
ncbi:uncharacterized protein ARMOST_15217 [Armillaria ostoyae]|uniref:F-box domain-containing protein n=1 Tax=Armillaria ostoyae TaxID=47428 RepID=A0A284RSR4_ARMOS|nr:uncharacterized protein ARMOST_15217 [Armillaria ostoyae]